jgi:hypothetical protein
MYVLSIRRPSMMNQKSKMSVLEIFLSIIVKDWLNLI